MIKISDKFSMLDLMKGRPRWVVRKVKNLPNNILFAYQKNDGKRKNIVCMYSPLCVPTLLKAWLEKKIILKQTYNT